MSHLSFLFRTDVHVSDRNPVSWKADYASELWSDLEQIGELARQHGVAAVLDGGDFFHIKAASRNPHSLVVKTAEIHRCYPCDTWAIEGNHDIAYNNLESIEKQPLGVLFAAGVFRKLREHVFVEPGLQVRVVGVPYSPFRTLAELQAIQKKEGDTHLIAVVHALAGAKPPATVESFFNEPVFRYEDLVTNNGPDCWAFGHWHKDQGIALVKGKKFVNQGAISRGALTGENLQRVPQVALIDVSEDGVDVKTIPLSVAPAERVFDLEQKAQRDEERRTIDEFIDRLVLDANVDPASDVRKTIESLEFAQAVRDEALRYLEQAES